MIKLKDILLEDCWKGYKQIGMKKKGKRQVPNCVPVNEVGEASATKYDWDFKSHGISDGESSYGFETDSGIKYEVQLAETIWVPFTDPKNSIPAVQIEFLAGQKTALGFGWSSKTVTNKGELYRVMATITDIIIQYLSKHKDIEALVYEPAKKSPEEIFGLQRDNLYKAFIKKAVPTAKFIKEQDSIIAIIK